MHSAVLAEMPMVIMSGESLTFGENPNLDIEGQWYRSLSIIGGPQRLVEPVTKWATQVDQRLHALRERHPRRRISRSARRRARSISTCRSRPCCRNGRRPSEPRKIPPPPKTQAKPADVERIADLDRQGQEPGDPRRQCRPRSRNRSRRSSSWPSLIGAPVGGSAARPTPISPRTIRCIWATASTAI